MRTLIPVLCTSGLAAEAKVARAAGFQVIVGAGDPERTTALIKAAIRQAKNFSSHTSVSDYGLLQTFISNLVDKCAVVDHSLGQQPLHLLTFLHTLRDRTWADIKSSLFA